MNKHTTIVTVGTSLMGNISRNYKQLQNDFANENYTEIANEVSKMSLENQQMLSAELNSTISMISAGIIETTRLILLVSDTENGRKCGNVLSTIFSLPETNYKFNNVEVEVIEGLNDESYQTFKHEGLRNLISIVSKYLREYAGSVCINNTGGYKAEIAYAGIIGQAFKVPVYYQFENFGTMIELPPLPISFDFDLFIKNIDMFMELYSNGCSKMLEIKDDDVFDYEELSSVVEKEEIDGKTYSVISPAGIIFVEAASYSLYRQGFLKESNIAQCNTAPKDKEINLCNSHHGNNLLLKFGKKICKSPYVSRIICSLPYNPHAEDPVRRITHENGRWYIDFVMIETDAGYTLRAEITASNLDEAKQIAARIYSNELR